MRGGERCLEVLCGMFPRAEIFTAFLRREAMVPDIARCEITVSPLNSLPFCRAYYRYLLRLYPAAAQALGRSLARSFAAKNYDLVISVSHCLAKNVPVPHGVHHLCYCLTPMRYIWDKYDSYFAHHRFEPIISRVAARLRQWDREQTAGVTNFVAISRFVAKRIETTYGRSADVIYPPVRSDWIAPRKENEKGEGFLCVSACVPYKNVDLIVRAFNELPYRLTVVGQGPMLGLLMKLARSNIRFVQQVSDVELGRLYRQSQALVFAAEEDFGMAPVESMAAGRPVICYGRGGVLETVRASGERPTGVYFEELTPEALRAAVRDFVRRQHEFSVDNSLEQAEKFSLPRFQHEFAALLDRAGFSAGMEQLPGVGKAVGMQQRC